MSTGKEPMLDPDRIEAYGKYAAAQRSAVVETLRKDVKISEETHQNSGAAWVEDSIAAAAVDRSRRSVNIPLWVSAYASTTATLHLFGQSEHSGFGFLSPFEELMERAADASEIDDVETTAVKEAKNLDELIKVARELASPEIADRLVELRDEPIDPEEGEQPLSMESVRRFLDYCIRRGVIKRPRMAVTPNGDVEGTWVQGKEGRVVIRFFPDGLVWVAINEPKIRGSFEAKASDLRSKKFRIRLPNWV